MTARKLFTAAGMTAVAGVAGAISYRHQQHLAVTNGQTYGLSLIWPLCVDGLVTVTAIAMSTDRADGYRPRLWALAGFWLGVAVSVATNWLATDGGVIAHCVSAFPALAFLLAIESLSSKPRARKASKTSDEFKAAIAALDLQDQSEDRNSGNEIDLVSPVAGTPKQPKPRSPRSDSNADRVAKAAARTPGATPAQLAARLELSDATVRRYLKSDKARTGTPVAERSEDLVPSAGEAINGFDLFADLSS